MKDKPTIYCLSVFNMLGRVKFLLSHKVRPIHVDVIGRRDSIHSIERGM